MIERCPLCLLAFVENEDVGPIDLARHFYWLHLRQDGNIYMQTDYPFSSQIETWEQAIAYCHRTMLGVNPKCKEQ